MGDEIKVDMEIIKDRFYRALDQKNTEAERVRQLEDVVLAAVILRSVWREFDGVHTSALCQAIDIIEETLDAIGLEELQRLMDERRDRR